MGYLADFEEDVFISYATIDNDCYPGEPTGWVSQLHEDLTKRVKARLGTDNVRLWRDVEIRNNDDFTNKIMGRLSRTATLLGVLSPSYLNREWTIRELETFVQHADRGVGILVNAEKSRIFKVEKLEVERDALPPAMIGTKSYRFISKENRREFRPFLEADRADYFTRLDDLAVDIANLLLEMARPTPRTARLPVYVAETTSDLFDQRDAIKRELVARGYAVLPEGDLPRNANEYRDLVRENLKLSCMSVHLVGAWYGLIPEGEARSIVRIQHDLAIECGAGRGFVRLIWMPSGCEPAEESQRNFVTYLRTDPDVQKNAEVMETKFEDLKSALQDKLAAIKLRRDQALTPKPEDRSGSGSVSATVVGGQVSSAVASKDDPATIYIICDKIDLASSQLEDLKNFLLDGGYEPVLPAENTFSDPSLTKHLHNLQSCDAFLIFYGAGSADWFADKLDDYRQYLRGRSLPVLAKGVYVALPETAQKITLRTNEAMVLRASSQFSATDIDPFVQRLATQRTGRP